MAFQARTQPSLAEENNVALMNGKDAVKPGLAAGKGSLLQQGSKRRAPLGDVSNNQGLVAGLAAGKPGVKASDPLKRGASARIPTKDGTAAAPVAAAPVAQNAAAATAGLGRTRSQTAAARQQGLSMSALLSERSTAAVTARKSAPPSPLPDIDREDRHNPLSAAEYVNDIYSYYRRVEPKFKVNAEYMSHQTDINEKMRAILVDWLVEVHLKFKLMPETLFLTVNLIDRFLEAKQVTRRNLQLVGVTAMLIASKYEEIWAPEVRDFVYISDKAYTREQILGMEKLMLNTLRFNLTLPTPYNFLARFVKAAHVHHDKQIALLTNYLAELALVDASMLKYSYSLMSVAATYVAMRTLSMPDPFPRALQRHSGYSKEEVQQCAAALVGLMQKAPTNTLNAVYKKYSNAKYLEVAKLEPCTAVLEEDAELL